MFIRPVDGLRWTRSWDEFQRILCKMRKDRRENWLYR